MVGAIDGIELFSKEIFKLDALGRDFCKIEV